MTPESYFNSTEGSRIEAVQRHMFADIYHQVPDSVESDVTEGHLLRFIEKVYNARKRDPAERAELTHLFQAAQYITESNGLEPSTACHEFFSGELLATELLSRVTGNRRGAGMLAYEGIRHSADGMSLVAPHLIQQSIQVADFPLEYEDLLTRIMLERQKRQSESDEFNPLYLRRHRECRPESGSNHRTENVLSCVLDLFERA